MPEAIRTSSIALSMVLGAALSVFLAYLLYTNYLVWHSYLQVVFWSFLMAQALRPLKLRIVSFLAELRQDDVAPSKRERLLIKVQSMSTEAMQTARESHNIARIMVAQSFLQFSLLLVMSAIVHTTGYVGLLSLLGIFAAICMCPWQVYKQLTSAAVVLMGYLLDVQLLRLHHYMGLSDNAMVTLILNIGVSLLLVFVVVFLGVQSLLEGAGAIEGAYNWIQTYIDGLSLLWFSPRAITMTLGFSPPEPHVPLPLPSSPFNCPRMPLCPTAKEGNLHNDLASISHYIEQGYEQVAMQFNETEWWPAAARLEAAVRTNTSMTAAVMDSRDILAGLYNNTTWWPLFDRIVTSSAAPATASGGTMSLWKDMSILQEAAMTVINALQDPVGLGLQFALTASNFLLKIGAYSSQLVAFFIFFYEMTSAEEDPLESVVRVMLPASPRSRDRILGQIQAAIVASFQIPLAMASVHAMITLTSYSLLGIPFTYFATFLSFFLSLTYIVNPLAVPAIWACAIGVPPLITGTNYFALLRGLLLLAAHILAYSFMDARVFQLEEARGLTHNPGLTIFAVVLGYYAFGTQGLIVGPLAFYLLTVIYNLRLQVSHEQDRRNSSRRNSSSSGQPQSQKQSQSSTATPLPKPSQSRDVPPHFTSDSVETPANGRSMTNSPTVSAPTIRVPPATVKMASF
ncbi:uncharacterized protein MONBRDRAFT_30115 [Monosiga brevicollis MX1]|uniref:Transmembrane protein 245 n=1 Tax=Monosiga brevicollis TaxID=81824 RepID=A9VD26_MONBE|nr:uncharacterized protein MONBRDRAFT_30115 [Monosiga brevicollis MX1]EDQ84605.1 predicted protein [Monosiga brevicollis MX1]|eukprot:XP_001750632.1 hypothetical protein [Monosiga brevicollis MX1]